MTSLILFVQAFSHFVWEYSSEDVPNKFVIVDIQVCPSVCHRGFHAYTKIYAYRELLMCLWMYAT